VSAHSRTPNIAAVVAPSQPETHWWSWLQHIAGAVNEIIGWINRQTNSGQFAELPNSPQIGTTAVITDSNTTTWGASVAGGGGNTVLAWWSGSAWKVIGI